MIKAPATGLLSSTKTKTYEAIKLLNMSAVTAGLQHSNLILILLV